MKSPLKFLLGHPILPPISIAGSIFGAPRAANCSICARISALALADGIGALRAWCRSARSSASSVRDRVRPQRHGDESGARAASGTAKAGEVTVSANHRN
jgi:hypothetical protein